MFDHTKNITYRGAFSDNRCCNSRWNAGRKKTGNFKNKIFNNCVESFISACNEHKKPAGFLDTNFKMLQKLKNKGFKILIDLYQFKIYWMIRKVVLSHESANDVLQNTYIKIYRNIDKFRQESKLSTWIYRIAYNESIRFLSNESKIKKISIFVCYLFINNVLCCFGTFVKVSWFC